MSRSRRHSRARWWSVSTAVMVLACAGGPDRVSDEMPEAPPQRIVAIAPSVTEMLFELGLGERVVGVGDYAQWPPEVATRPRLGGLLDARLEVIAGLKPDLAVLLPSEAPLRTDLEAMGVEVLTVPSDSIADVEAMALLIGERCGVTESAEAFARQWRLDLAPREPENPARVLLAVTREPGTLADILVAGPGTFLDELLQRLGLVNVVADAQVAYPQVGLEEIILRQPDVVIELQAAPGTYDDLQIDWKQGAPGSTLPEVCVRVIAGHHVLIPGPRLPRLLRELDAAVADCAQLP